MANADMAREIPLAKGLVALVSPEDFTLVSAFKWHMSRGGNRYYVVRSAIKPDGKRYAQGLHRLLLNAPDGRVVDHISGDSLDNRRSNLRLCSNAENIRNQARRVSSKTSCFKGVSYNNKGWRAKITHNGNKIALGTFDDEERAARQYDRMARVLFGHFARTNAAMGLLTP